MEKTTKIDEQGYRLLQIVEWMQQIGLKGVTSWEVNLTAARVAQNKRAVPAARITEQPPDSNPSTLPTCVGTTRRISSDQCRVEVWFSVAEKFAKEARMFQTATSSLCLGILALGSLVLGQRTTLNHSAAHTFTPSQTSAQSGQISGSCPELPATRLVTYQKDDLEIRHPENWYISETGNTVTLAPEGGIV